MIPLLKEISRSEDKNPVLNESVNTNNPLEIINGWIKKGRHLISNVLRNPLSDKNRQDVDNEEKITFLEPPHIKKEKDEYQTEVLKKNHGNLSENFKDLIKNYSGQNNPEEKEKISTDFEATIDYCIEKRKSRVETVFLNIIRGVACGILKKNHIHYFQKHLKYLPVLAYLTDSKLLRKSNGFQKLANRFSGNDGEKKFRNFYWTEIMNNPTARREVVDRADESQYDHDHIGEFGAAGGVKLIRPALEKGRPTAINNMYLGTYQYLESNQPDIKNTLKKCMI